MALAAASCSQDEEILNPIDESSSTVQDEYVYTLHMDCPSPSFEEGTTRAVSWANGSTVYLLLKNGSSYTTGKATYSSSSSSWTVTTSSSISTSSSDLECEAFYVEDPSSTTSSVVNMNAFSALYSGVGTYTHPNSSEIFVKVTMSPESWRLRFKGTKGAQINVSSSAVNVFNKLTLSSGSTTKSQLSTTLTVGSDGYTPYIYGLFSPSSGNNKITVVTSEGTFTRDISGSSLKVKGSAYLNVPTVSSHDKWTCSTGPVKNCTVKPKFFKGLQYGWGSDFTPGVNVNTWYSSTFSETYYNSFEGDEEAIIKVILDDNTPCSYDDAKNYTVWDYSDTFYKRGATYYYLTIAYDKNGNRGELVSTKFTTLPATLPLAQISNLTGTYEKWKFDITFKNGATKYYGAIWEGNGLEDYPDAYLVYDTYRNINNGDNTSIVDYTSTYVSREGKYAAIVTIATDTRGYIGDYSIARASYGTRAAAPASKQSEGKIVAGKYSKAHNKTGKYANKIAKKPYLLFPVK